MQLRLDAADRLVELVEERRGAVPVDEAAQAGYERAGLGVDADNPTGALGLYESLGFTVQSKFISYSRPL